MGADGAVGVDTGNVGVVDGIGVVDANAVVVEIGVEVVVGTIEVVDVDAVGIGVEDGRTATCFPLLKPSCCACSRT